MYHRPIGCSESDYATCLQLIRLIFYYLLLTDQVLIREDEINCMDSVVINVAPLSSDNEDVFGRPRHSEEAVRVAATLREVDPCHEEKRVGPCKAAIPRLVASHSHKYKYLYTNTFTQIQERGLARRPYRGWLPLALRSCHGSQCNPSPPRFFFDVESGSCSSFNYGGCRGNGNNFATQQDCEAKCVNSRR